jgi:hypothetical protein
VAGWTLRPLVAQLGERVGQPFAVNRGGGAGNIVAEGVYHSEPDGYTLLASRAQRFRSTIFSSGSNCEPRFRAGIGST